LFIALTGWYKSAGELHLSNIIYWPLPVCCFGLPSNTTARLKLNALILEQAQPAAASMNSRGDGEQNRFNYIINIGQSLVMSYL